MLEILKLHLQLFGEGGDGGDGGSASSTGEGAGDTTSGDNIPSSIPERAKKYYQKAMEKTKASAEPKAKTQTSDVTHPTNESGTTERLPYLELIKSDEYKDDHKAYMDKTIGDRLKKYKGIEETSNKQKALLEIVASKYGVSPDDENFLDVLQQKVDEDDSYYEQYAIEHDCSNEDARKFVNMERKIARIEAEEKEKERQEQANRQIMLLHQNAERTKARFPAFDLESEMQNEKFRRLCAVNNGDTTAAYMACHYDEIINSQVQMASRQIQMQTAQAVASNKARPVENGLSSSAPSVVQTDFRNMNLNQIRQYADEQRRKQAGR